MVASYCWSVFNFGYFNNNWMLGIDLLNVFDFNSQANNVCEGKYLDF